MFWAHPRGIKFNAKKFKVILNTVDTHVQVHFEGVPLKVFKHVRYLGVILSTGHAMDYACWGLETHIEALRLRLKSNLAPIRFLSRSHLKIPVLVFPTLGYGMSVGPILYSNRLLSNEPHSSLDKLEASFRGDPSLPNEITSLEAGIPPLEVQRSVTGIRTLGRPMSLPNPIVFLEAFDSWRREVIYHHPLTWTLLSIFSEDNRR